MATIMVVDDDSEFTSLYQAYLKMVGFEAIVENVSSKAIEVATAAGPDLFILDLMMPEPDGFKLCRMLRKISNFKRTPIIIVTALNDKDSRLVALGAGANAYMTKPFHIDDLKIANRFPAEKEEISPLTRVAVKFACLRQSLGLAEAV